MNKVAALVATGLFLVLQAQAGQMVEISFGAGYGLGLGGQMDYFGEATYTRRQNPDTAAGADQYVYSEYKDLYTTLGNGAKVDIAFAVFPVENVGIVLATGFSFLGGYTSKQATRYLSGNTSETEYKLNAMHIPVNLGMKIRGKLGPISPYAYVAPGVYLPVGVKAESTNEATGSPTSTSEVRFKYAPGFGVTSGLGSTIEFGSAVGLKIELCPTFAFVRVKEMIIEDMDDGSKATYIFEKNKAILSQGTSSGTESTSYMHGGPTHSFHSVALKVGIAIGF